MYKQGTVNGNLKHNTTYIGTNKGEHYLGVNLTKYVNDT